MRLLLDEHLSPRVARELRQAGHDVVATAERPDLRGLGDAELVRIAATERRALVSFDIGDHIRIYRDSVRLQRPHPGLVLLAPSAWRLSDTGVGALVRALGRLLDRDTAEAALIGSVLWLEPGRDLPG